MKNLEDKFERVSDKEFFLRFNPIYGDYRLIKTEGINDYTFAAIFARYIGLAIGTTFAYMTIKELGWNGILASLDKLGQISRSIGGM